MGRNWEGNIDWIKARKKSILIACALIWGAIIIAFLIFGLACRGYNSDPEAIRIGIGSETLVTMNYEDVEEILREKGFTNIRLDNSKGGLFKKSGEVWQISIDGVQSFFNFSKFSKDDLIIIFYYK